MTLNRGVVAMCAAQACAQIGAFGVAALLPTLIPAWSLSNTEAGWISGIYYAAYTLAVPLLSSLTDRVDPKRIYLGSVALTAVAFAGFAWVATGFWSALAFRALMGVGWAGSYMPGLKALSDLPEGPQQSRAVAAHAAAVGVSGALSFGVAGAVNAWLGWQWALVPGALGAALAFVLVLIGLPARPPRASAGPRGRCWISGRSSATDRRSPTRSPTASTRGRCPRCAAWVVTFLTFAAARAAGAWTPLAPATVASVMGLLGVWASVWGNELAIRFGRRRFILGTMLASAAMAGVIGFSAALPYAGAAALVLVYAMLIWSDSSSLTAGSAGSAEPGRRGATLAVHSTLGYAGGFLGPLALGATLDLFGGASVLGWGMAFGHVTVALLSGARLRLAAPGRSRRRSFASRHHCRPTSEPALTRNPYFLADPPVGRRPLRSTPPGMRAGPESVDGPGGLDPRGRGAWLLEDWSPHLPRERGEAGPTRAAGLLRRWGIPSARSAGRPMMRLSTPFRNYGDISRA